MKKLTVVTFNGTFLPKFQNKPKMSILTTFIQYFQGNKVNKRKKGHTYQEGRGITLFADDKFLHRRS